MAANKISSTMLTTVPFFITLVFILPLLWINIIHPEWIDSSATPVSLTNWSRVSPIKE
jgi:hypothetical protein